MNGIDFEQELYKHFGQVKDFTLGMRIGKYFYELGKQSKGPVSHDLEEAAKANTDELWRLCSWQPNWDDLYESFIAGAEWQREQNAARRK